MKVELPYDYEPRWYQLPSWNALWPTGSQQGDPENDVRRAFCLHHRRAGKDLNMFNLFQCKIAQRVGLYIHVFPTLKEGRKVIWNGMNREGRRFLDYIPGHAEFVSSKTRSWVVRKRDDDMTIEYANGSIYQVLGADDPDSIRGIGPVGVCLSEYAFYKGPKVYDIIRPMLAENDGFMAAITTPNGRNHSHALHMRFQKLQKTNPIYFAETLPASYTGAVHPDRIQEDRDSGMSEEKVAAEYECSYDAPVEGSFYGDALKRMREEVKFTSVPYERGIPVDTYWDLGVRDASSIWFAQRVGREHHLIDFAWFTGTGLNEMAKDLHERPYTYGKHFAPHDITVREIGADYAATRLETARKLGVKFTVVPRRDVEDGINATRALLAKTWIDDDKCQLGIDALHSYRRKEIEGLVGPGGEKLYGKEPEHSWASHPADALRTGAMGLALAGARSSSERPVAKVAMY